MLLLVSALAVAGACTSNVESRPRLLDESCGGGECATSGAALQTTGLTADSIGYKLGAGPARLTIPLQSFSDLNHDAFNAEVLVEGHGTITGRLLQGDCDGIGPCDVVDEHTLVLPRQYDWVRVGTFVSSSSGTQSFKDFFIQIEIDDQHASSELELADIRYDSFDALHCSVYAPGRR
jgi:hypothetical protein